MFIKEFSPEMPSTQTVSTQRNCFKGFSYHLMRNCLGGFLSPHEWILLLLTCKTFKKQIENDNRLWRNALPPVSSRHVYRALRVAEGDELPHMAYYALYNAVHSSRERSVFHSKALPHSSPIISLAANSLGSLIATVSQDGQTRIWEKGLADVWKRAAVITGIKGHTLVVATDLAGSLVVTGSVYGTIRVYERKKEGGWQATSTFSGHRASPVFSIATNSNGSRFFTGSGDGTVRIWQRDMGKWQTTDVLAIPQKPPVYSAAVNGAGSMIATGSGDGKVRIWECLENGWQKTSSFRVSSIEHWRLRVTMDSLGSSIVTKAGDGIVRLWERGAHSGWQTTSTFQGSPDHLYSIALNSSGLLMSFENQPTIWQRVSRGNWRKIAALPGHSGVVSNVVTESNSLIATGFGDGVVRIWTLNPSLSNRLELLERRRKGEQLPSFSEFGQDIIEKVSIFLSPQERRNLVVNRDVTMCLTQRYRERQLAELVVLTLFMSCMEAMQAPVR